MKKFFFFFIIVLIFFLLIELILKSIKPTPYIYDTKLGWKLKNNFSFIYKQKDLYNVSYFSDYSTNKFGARYFLYKFENENNRFVKKKDNYKLVA